MDGKTYWEQRAIDSIGRMEKSVNGQIPDLVDAFEAAKRDLNDKVFYFYARYAKNNRITLDEAQKALSLSELREFRGDLATYEKLAKDSIGTFNLEVDNLSVKARVTRYEALLTQCDAVLQKLYQKQKEQIEGTAEDVYTSEYYHSLFDIEKYTGFKFNFSQPAASAIHKVIEQPVSGMDISEHLWRQDIDTGFKIRSTLNDMFVTGKPPQYFADQLQKQIGAVHVDKAGNVTGTGKKREAYRLLYTESAHVTNQAQLQACEDDGIDEFEDIVTLDGHTCPDCAEYDGKHYLVSKAVEGVNCPPWHPFCRCTTAPYIPELANLSSGRMSRDPVTGASVPTEAQTYDEWKTQIDKKNALTNAAGHPIMKVNKVRASGLPPGSITQKVNAKGGIDRNYYDGAGKQTKQISDNGHGHKKEEAMGKHGEHAHDYYEDEAGNRKHGPARELTDEERKENGDIL